MIPMTNQTNATRILAGSLRSDWWVGRFGIERRCDCRKGQRSAECHEAGWHLIDSSNDPANAIAHAITLAPHGTYRVVDQDDYSVIS